jgi:peptide/nickel transport system substrate-binding protein
MHRKRLMALGLVAVLALLLSSCGPTPEPQVIEKEVIVTQEVEKEVVVTKEVEVVKEVEVTRVVEGEPVVEVVTATPEPEPTVPVRTGEVVVLGAGEASTLDWHMHCDMNAHEPCRNIYDTLLMRDQETLEIVPHLAESYELLEPTLWRFKLREGVTFHNGEPFNAEAVKFSLDRFVDPDQGTPARANLAQIDRVEVVDEYTVDIYTTEPFPLLPVRMTSGHCGTVAMVPPNYIQENGDDYVATHPVGTGPFKFVEWVPDEYIHLEANEDYFLGPPAFKDLYFKPVPELATRVSALISGQADLVVNIPPTEIEKVKNSGVADIKETTLGAFMIMTKITNTYEDGPWTDPRVRQAINYAIDTQTLVDTILEGHGSVLGFPLEREAFGYNPDAPEYYPYDPEKAKELLAEAGYPDGFDFTIHAPNRRYLNDIEMAQGMAAYLTEIGINTSVQVWEQSVYATKWRFKELLPAYIVAWGGAGLFDGDIMTNWGHTDSALSIYSNPEFDQLLDSARGTADPAEREALYFQAQELVYPDAPVIKSWQQGHIFGISNRLDWEPFIDNMLFMYWAKLNE